MREIVHHIPRQTAGLCPRRHKRPDVATARNQISDHSGKIGSQWIASGKLNSRRVGGLEAVHIMIAIGRVPANARARRRQQAQFRPRQFAGANEQHGTGLQIEKYRQESHAALTSPTYGVDWNYFLYMSRSMPAKRKLFLLYCGATIENFAPTAKVQRCIFSTRIPPWTSCVGTARPRDLWSGKSRPMHAPISPPWITSTRSRRRASTFSGKPSRA